MTRSRTNSVIVTNGYFRRFGITNGLNGVNMEVNSCTDSPGYGLGDNLAFQVDHDYLKGGKIDQLVKDGGNYFVAYFDNYTADSFTFAGRPLFPLITSYPGELSSAAYAAATLARTNPSRPYVDMIQNVLEIGDIPRVLKVAGETLIEKLAENYIRYQFGIAPIVKDVSRLIDWSANVNKKLAIINKIRSTGGYRKTVTLDRLSAKVTNSNVVIQSNGSFFTDTFDTIGSRVIKGHARYLPTVDYSKYSQVEMSALAKRAVIGLEWNFSGLWEGIPWSWLIDWYSNVGDLLQATRNVIPVTCQSVTLMRHTTSVSQTNTYSDGIRRIAPATVTKERKERYPASATLDAHLPLLSADQLGILASLLVMKHKYVSPR